MRTHHRRGFAVLAAALLLQAVAVTAAIAQDPITVQRISGPDRFATAVAVSQASWPGGSDTVFVATGQNFADALAVGAAAAGNGPVLLVERDRIPVETASELRRLGPDLIVVVGGTAAISSAVEVGLARHSEDVTVRVAGPDRYATAAEISKAFFAENPERVYVASGATFQDALAASAAAGGFGGPVLLTTPTKLPDATASELERLAPASIVVVGDTADVSTGVFSQISDFGSTIRIAGVDDAETSAFVSLNAFVSSPTAVLATVADFPDALAGGAFAAGLPVPLLLTDPNDVPDAVACELLRLGTSQVIVLGGTQAVSRAVVDELEAGFDIGDLPGCDLPITLDVPGAPLYDLVVTPDQSTAYIVNNRWNRVEVLDLEERDFLAPIPVGSGPVDIDITPDGSKLYVTNDGSQTITEITVATGATDEFRIEAADGDEQIDPERSFMLVVGQGGRALLASTSYPALDAGLNVYELDLDTRDFTQITLPAPPGEPTDVAGFRIRLEDILTTTSGQQAELVVDGQERTVSEGEVIGTNDEGLTVTVTEVLSPDVTLTVTGGEEPEEVTLTLPTASAVRMERSGDHRFVALSINGTDLIVADTSQPDLEFTTQEVLTGGAGAVSELALDQDGSRLLMDDGAGTAFVLDGAQRLLGTVTSPSGSTFGLAFTPDGDTAYRVTDAGIEVIDVDRYLVEEPCQLLLAGGLAEGGGKNQPSRALNQLALAGSGDDVTLIAVTATGVQLFLDPPLATSPCAFEPTA